MHLIQKILTKNDCYKAGRKITPKGIMLHSTGANNPKISRYVPIGTSTNHWDKPGIEKCVHGFIGLDTNGQVATCQTLPWNWRGWHCGTGKKGSANNTHISFEVCEDALTDKKYFEQVYQEAVETFAYICELYNLNPMKDGVIISHHEGYLRGVASNHGDIDHWFKKFSYTMDGFRLDVKRQIEYNKAQTTNSSTPKEEDKTVSYEQFVKYLEQWLAEQATKEQSEWSKNEGYLNTAIATKILNEPHPQSFVTQEQAIAFMFRIMNKFGGNNP